MSFTILFLLVFHHLKSWSLHDFKYQLLFSFLLSSLFFLYTIGDTTGLQGLIYRRKVDTAAGSGSTTLNTFLQLGDVIEYRDPSHKSQAKKSTIVSIGALTSSKNILGLDSGDWLHKGVHQVRRMLIKQLDHDDHIPNPNPVWKCLTKVMIITPYQEVY